MNGSKVFSEACPPPKIVSDPQKDPVTPYRAVPLSTRQIFGTVVSLALFSFVYLAYAQHHALLFYVMTGLVGIYIVFVYVSGIFAVLYMVIVDYDLSKTASIDAGEQQESSI
ncbi:unnamed protein product [Caenorhabditis auriculariae]|uniref:Uncharacterized protein n=1 Tax=Caenorhabditis auriculariae TaxID=2777116 RepID=A0A8S1HQJ4_9PELO|nr:unnamed protein product [Caenorhabditis auriculariae]